MPVSTQDILDVLTFDGVSLDSLVLVRGGGILHRAADGGWVAHLIEDNYLYAACKAFLRDRGAPEVDLAANRNPGR